MEKENEYDIGFTRVKQCNECCRFKQINEYRKTKRWYRAVCKDCEKKQRQTVKVKSLCKLIDYIAINPCTVCGEKDWLKMQFHHWNGKHKTISYMVKNGYSWDKIKAEIAKCKVCCANCHQAKHAQDHFKYLPADLRDAYGLA